MRLRRLQNWSFGALWTAAGRPTRTRHNGRELLGRMIEELESLSVIAVDGGMCAAPVQRVVVVHVFGVGASCRPRMPVNSPERSTSIPAPSPSSKRHHLDAGWPRGHARCCRASGPVRRGAGLARRHRPPWWTRYLKRCPRCTGSAATHVTCVYPLSMLLLGFRALHLLIGSDMSTTQKPFSTRASRRRARANRLIEPDRDVRGGSPIVGLAGSLSRRSGCSGRGGKPWGVRPGVRRCRPGGITVALRCIVALLWQVGGKAGHRWPSLAIVRRSPRWCPAVAILSRDTAWGSAVPDIEWALWNGHAVGGRLCGEVWS